MNLEAEISLKKALVIIVAALLVFLSGGYAVGKVFFWNQFPKENLENLKIKSAKEVIKQNPKDYKSHLGLGAEYLYLEKYEEALKEYKIAEKLAPKDYMPVKLNLGLVYVQLKKYDLAIKNLEIVIKKNPIQFEAYVNLGYAYEGKNDYKKALKVYEEALKVEPGAADVKVSKALVYEKMGNKKEALKSINDALKFVPDYKEWLEIKARLTK